MSSDPWSELGSVTQRLIGQRVAAEHPLDIYWVKAADGAPGLLFRGVDPARVPYRLPKPRGLSLEVEEGQDGFEARMFLREPDDRDVFLTLCNDVIAWSGNEKSRSTASASVFRRLSHWHSLMTRARTSAMPPHEVRGLIGELYVLERLIARRSFGAALTSWVAPDDHPQDFAFDTRIIEVKTRVAGARQHVQISSLEQLDSAHLPLSLVVIELVLSDAGDAISLNGLCDRLASTAMDCGVAEEDALHAALLRRGYIRQEAYDVDAYNVAGIMAFDVLAGFPRLTRTDVDARIPQVQYVLDATHLGAFGTDIEAVLGGRISKGD
ncbi:PD-(D/E)XK motif protein [Luteimonas composti]|uniref:PD-(D/E)XK motif protein n=1 Tax=Luteimonas composti TaxID=398257 RepID=A0ABT6MR90_9GAMM|nr:PD-(D/E)XK motif protein [Luteimonas composti]MDH7453135.1 PD-(D/E)XK motif protein [Luteimonas composti]